MASNPTTSTPTSIRASTSTSALVSASSTSVLITGTSRGSVGSALAAAFARRKLIVFATARDLSKIDPALASLPNVHTLHLDVNSPQSISRAVQAVHAKTDGKLNYLINNAGAGYTIPLADVNIDMGKEIFDVNFWGVLRVTKAFVPSLLQTGGTVVNISSVGGLVHTPWIGIYSASKAALTCASETLRLELSPFNIKVTTVMLGAVTTNFHTNNAPYRLPGDSMYSSISRILADCNAGKLNPAGTDVDKVAERLVVDTLHGAKGKIFRANMASTTKWVSALMPSSSLDGMLAKDRGLDILKAKFAARKT